MSKAYPSNLTHTQHQEMGKAAIKTARTNSQQLQKELLEQIWMDKSRSSKKN
ncbi:hypothetical protein HW132_25600 [Brasilonema sp. CT11]|nr:hypothetical protein [Brasilonema sp. CT11]